MTYTWKFYLGLFAVCAAYFGVLHWVPGFVDPDAFYHAQMARLIAEQHAAVKEFPWLSLTSLGSGFIDHQFLYHLILIPFVLVFPPLVGIKVATVLFASLFVTFFMWLLLHVIHATAGIQHTIQRPLIILFLLLILTNAPFILRLDLAKTTAISLLFLFGALSSMFRGRALLLGLLSFLYVWLYGGWPIVLIASGCAWLSRALYEGTWKNFKLPIAALIGCMAGLVLNPYFPQNLSFYWLQTIKIPFSPGGPLVGVGAEWYSQGFSFIPAHGILLIGFFVAAWILATRRHDWKIACVGLLTVLFAALTIKSQRHIEYFAPCAFFFIGLTLLPVLSKISILHEPLSIVAQRFIHHPLWQHVLVVYLAVIFGCLTFMNAGAIISVQRNNAYFTFSAFDGAAQWLQAHTAQGERVFHDGWDDFPQLFFTNPHNTYITGLDPRFLCQASERLCREYEQIIDGTVKRGVTDTIVRDFESRVILVRTQNKELLKKLAKEKITKEVYRDSTAVIFTAIHSLRAKEEDE